MDKSRIYSRIARIYDLLDMPFEHGRYRPLRRLLFAGLSGRILDAGVGTGRNAPCYPENAAMVGIDITPAMLRVASARTRRIGARVELAAMDVCRTAFADDSFDAVVATFLFCVLEDDRQLPALKELARICKPGGEIRILEYTLSQDPLRRFIMRLWGPWVRLVYGAGFERNTEQYIDDAGLVLVESRFVYRDMIKFVVMKPRVPYTKER